LNKKAFISHTDLDGHNAITLAMFFNQNLGFSSFYSRDYGFLLDKEDKDFFLSFDEIIIADLSISPEDFEEFTSKNIHVEIYDHHEAAEYLKEKENCCHDNDRCGTKIFWEEYVIPRIKRFPPIINEFVTLTDIYDLWRIESPLWEDAKALNSILYGMKIYSITDGIKQTNLYYELMMRKFKFLRNWELLDHEKRLVERAKKREEDMYKKARDTMEIRVDKKGKIFGVFALASKISLVASRILEEEPEIDYLVVINTWGGIQGRLSFRSRSKINCNDIGVAAGHGSAAGAGVGPDVAIKFLENPKLAFRYEDDKEFDKEDDKTFLEEV
jgi:oligoribonuclease NrnB/cAMP/cGMP phosphodiesterase (DHH superfamily)